MNEIFESLGREVGEFKVGDVLILRIDDALNEVFMVTEYGRGVDECTIADADRFWNNKIIKTIHFIDRAVSPGCVGDE